jgi:hypothetical protein
VVNWRCEVAEEPSVWGRDAEFELVTWLAEPKVYLRSPVGSPKGRDVR